MFFCPKTSSTNKNILNKNRLFTKFKYKKPLPFYGKYLIIDCFLKKRLDYCLASVIIISALRVPVGQSFLHFYLISVRQVPVPLGGQHAKNLENAEGLSSAGSHLADTDNIGSLSPQYGDGKHSTA